MRNALGVQHITKHTLIMVKEKFIFQILRRPGYDDSGDVVVGDFPHNIIKSTAQWLESGWHVQEAQWDEDDGHVYVLVPMEAHKDRYFDDFLSACTQAKQELEAYKVAPGVSEARHQNWVSNFLQKVRTHDEATLYDDVERTHSYKVEEAREALLAAQDDLEQARLAFETHRAAARPQPVLSSLFEEFKDN